VAPDGLGLGTMERHGSEKPFGAAGVASSDSKAGRLPRQLAAVMFADISPVVPLTLAAPMGATFRRVSISDGNEHLAPRRR